MDEAIVNEVSATEDVPVANPVLVTNAAPVSNVMPIVNPEPVPNGAPMVNLVPVANAALVDNPAPVANVVPGVLWDELLDENMAPSKEDNNHDDDPMVEEWQHLKMERQ
ncbi:hypothetical protein CBL_06339 [Carabus blaptoides fortunei]